MTLAGINLENHRSKDKLMCNHLEKTKLCSWLTMLYKYTVYNCKDWDEIGMI